jgi:Ser/Thr protein kinase RdoA (MazF antagonist)
MMNVQTMRHVVDEVQAGSVPRVATTAAGRWNGGAPVHWRSSANHVFRLVQDGRPRYLRLAHASQRRQDAIQAEMDFVLHAARSGLAVARPIPSARGALVEELVDGADRYHAVLFEALPGRQLEVDDLDGAALRAWGGALAHLHEASATFPASAARPHWRDEIRAALLTVPPDETAVSAVLESELRWLDALPEPEYGLLHGDLELDNLFWDGSRIHVLDFDEAAYGWYAVDIATALADVWLGGGPGRDERVGRFLDGYSRVRPVPAGARAMLPRLVRLLMAFKMARLLHAYANTDDASSPAWVTAMRARHQRGLNATRAELVAGPRDETRPRLPD